MNIKAMMEAIRDDLTIHLPSLFQAEGVKNVDYFTVGSPTNQEQRFCCVGLASFQSKKQIEFIIHLAIPRVSELESYGYIQAVKEYLDNEFDQTAYGFDTGDYELQIFETEFMRGDIQIAFSVTLNRLLDDCD